MDLVVNYEGEWSGSLTTRFRQLYQAMQDWPERGQAYVLCKPSKKLVPDHAGSGREMAGKYTQETRKHEMPCRVAVHL